MPGPLDTCLFTTSGTEANELAWRMATAWTGGNAAVIAEHAYHGSTKWMADLSSNEWPAGYHPDHVATFAAPRPSTGGVDRQTAAGRVSAAAARLADRGDKAALVLADLGFTSEGILDAPAGFIAGLIDGAHRAGALFLADEVQAGFGRVGLARDYEHFSTFAGTPAATAASLAVLDVLENERILERTATVGNQPRDKLRELARHDARLGDVRGTGLIAGIEITGQPHAQDRAGRRALARALLDSLRDLHVLAGLTGPDGTVLKVRPPLIWHTGQADLFVATVAESLATRNRSQTPKKTHWPGGRSGVGGGGGVVVGVDENAVGSRSAAVYDRSS
jgi:4-aminobutyrate aminotransferase-like enzyme